MKLSELIADEINYNWLDHETLDTSAAIDAIIARLHECDDLPPNAAQRARITELEAQLNKVKAERDEHEGRALFWAGASIKQDGQIETYRAAIPAAYQMALEAGAVTSVDYGKIQYSANIHHHPQYANAAADDAIEIGNEIRALTPPADLVDQVVAKVKGGE